MPVVYVPREAYAIAKGFEHCDAPLDKIPKMTVGWVEYVAIRKLMDLSCPVMRIMLLKTAAAIAHLWRVTEHCPEESTATRGKTGRMEYAEFKLLPSLLDPYGSSSRPMAQ